MTTRHQLRSHFFQTKEFPHTDGNALWGCLKVCTSSLNSVDWPTTPVVSSNHAMSPFSRSHQHSGAAAMHCSEGSNGSTMVDGFADEKRDETIDFSLTEFSYKVSTTTLSWHQAGPGQADWGHSCAFKLPNSSTRRSLLPFSRDVSCWRLKFVHD